LEIVNPVASQLFILSKASVSTATTINDGVRMKMQLKIIIPVENCIPADLK
jgi:hypothetical protein